MSEGQPLRTPKIYMDANVLAYFLEGHSRYAEIVGRFVKRALKRELTLVGSELLIAELMVKPIQDGDIEGAWRLRQALLNGGFISILPLDSTTFVFSAFLRPSPSRDHPKLGLADALHLASAKQLKCDSLLTNDKKLAKVAGSMGILLDDYLDIA